MARLNFSHGTHASHRKLARHVRQASRLAKRNVALLADLQGPKIRLGDLKEEQRVQKGDVVTLPLSTSGLSRFLKKGTRVLIDDGKIEAVYQSGRGNHFTIKMQTSGVFSSHKGVAFPGRHLPSVRAFTDEDKRDLLFALDLGVDWVVVSFVTHPDDVREVQAFIKKHAVSTRRPSVMAKVERAKAVERFLVATHLLESMSYSPVPTRAELSDVANAVIDHTDAVMLSGETASGAYPVETVQMMADIVRETEASCYNDVLPRLQKRASRETTLALILAELALLGRVQSIAIHERDAAMAWKLLPYRPEVPIFLMSPDARWLSKELIRWGIVPVRVPSGLKPEDTAAIARLLRKEGQVAKGHTVTVVHRQSTQPTFTTHRVL
ncbi:MAG: Pyruvate kinase [Parcubacteria group bacterium GW2011_GWA2_56_7]|nr:MAG: Pyruvate kinase [Parcubacteria group bacterium GW2011_GWA2_56_7]